MFKQYLKSVGYVYVLLIVVMYGLYTGSSMSALIFLSSWTDDPGLANFTKWPPDSSARRHQNDYYISIYGLFGFFQSKCNICGVLVWKLLYSLEPWQHFIRCGD